MSILRDPFAIKTSELIWEQLEQAEQREPSPVKARRKSSRPKLLRRNKAWPDQF